ncbi:MAG TPA: sensor histidine kinase [Anaerolineaceae bacterium]
MQRWGWTWNGISLLMLLISTAVCVLDTGLPVTTRLSGAGFALLYALWYAVFVLRPGRWSRKSAVLGLSFAAMILVTAAMATLNGLYFMLFFSMYGLVFSLMDLVLAIPMTGLVSLVGAASILYTNHIPIRDSLGVILGFVLSTVVTVLMGYFINAIVQQSSARQRVIEELQAARADLAAAERQAGIFQERQRLAREIHDRLAQGFTSIVLHLEAADQALPPSLAVETARQHLDRARQTARDSLAEARSLVWALRPESQERENLNQALERVVGRWSQETSIPANVQVTGARVALPPEDQVTLLRCAQEALVNIHKHAQAHQVILTLSYLEDQVILDVQDDGIGFVLEDVETPGPVHGGYGLIGLRERVRQQGGSLSVESEPGEGATLVVVLPLGAPLPVQPESQEAP